MKFTTTDVKDLMLYGERINIEYKEAASDLPKSLWETYSTFANTVWNGDSISNTELQQLLDLNSIEVGKILHQMVEKQLLNKVNKNRWTTYTLLKEDSADSAGEEKSEEKTNVTDNEETTQKGGQKRWSEKVGRKGGQKKNKKTVDTILLLINENSCITRKILAETIGISQSVVQKHINRLKVEQIIIRHGGDRGGYWEIFQ